MNDLDKILRFLIEHFNAKKYTWMPNIKYIQEELFPFYNDDQIISLLNKIQNNRPDVLLYKRTDAGDIIKITGLTEDFLNKGGFTYVENNWKIEDYKRKEKENIEFEKNKVELELAKKMLKEYPKTKWFARIGAFIGIFLALKELYEWIMQLN